MATQYRNTGGRHTQMDGTVVATGALFVDSDDELCSKFAGKFEVVGKVEAQEPLPTGDETDPPKTGTDVDKPGTDHLVADGEDVTDEYPNAVKAGLKVVKTKKGWTVYDAEGSPINDAPLKKKDVDDVINEWIEE